MPADARPCPRCSGGSIVLKHSHENKPFYGCTRYPKCEFSSSRPIINERCPQCSTPYLLEKSVRKVLWAVCPNRECKYERRLSVF